MDVGDDDQLRVFETLTFDLDEETHRPAEQHHGEGGSAARDSARGHAATVFAHDLAERLRVGRNQQAFRDLVLIAAPRFLGMLRDALDHATAAMVRGTLDKDYAGLNDRDLLKRLEKM